MACNQLPPDIGRQIAEQDPRRRPRIGARAAGRPYAGLLIDIIWGASWTLIVVLLMISSGL